MLDFNKLAWQINEVGCEDAAEASGTAVLPNAQAAFEDASHMPAILKAKLRENGGQTFWPLALPIDPFGSIFPVDTYKGMHTVVACDGSQIMPSQHEVYSCYLLNVGEVVIHYGCRREPVLSSFPRLYHKKDEVYPLIDQRRIHVDESIVSLERQLLELCKAAELCLQHRDDDMPIVVLLDGSLIPWNIDRMPESFQHIYLERVQAVLDVFIGERIPLLAYVSHSRSTDVVNMLRVWRCPYPSSRCQTMCGHLNEEDFPCSQLWPLSDRLLFSSKLKSGSRSGMFVSGSRWSNMITSRHRVCFCYLHTDSEVARIEVPRWLVEDEALLELAMSVVYLQSQKGAGYPVALAEAHNLAVIRQADRKRFFEMLTARLVSLGIDRVTVSPKEKQKRRSII